MFEDRRSKAMAAQGPSLPSVAAAYLIGHQGPIQVLCFTADGKYCLTGGNDRSVRLWNPYRIDPATPASSAKPCALPIQNYSALHSYPITAIAVDELSQKLASSSEKTLVISDIVTGQLIRKFRGHEGRINALCCSSDASLYLSGSYDATVRIWDAKSRSQEPIQVLKEARDSISTVMLIEDKKEILSSSVDGCIRTYDVRNGKMKIDHCTDAITSICSSHDGLCLAASCLDGNINLIEKQSGQLLNNYSGHHDAGKYGIECGITSNDAYIVSGSESGNVVVYDLVTGKLAKILGEIGKPTCSIAVHPRRERCSVVLSGGYDGKAIVWASPEEIQRWDR